MQEQDCFLGKFHVELVMEQYSLLCACRDGYRYIHNAEWFGLPAMVYWTYLGRSRTEKTVGGD